MSFEALSFLDFNYICLPTALFFACAKKNAQGDGVAPGNLSVIDHGRRSIDDADVRSVVRFPFAERRPRFSPPASAGGFIVGFPVSFAVSQYVPFCDPESQDRKNIAFLKPRRARQASLGPVEQIKPTSRSESVAVEHAKTTSEFFSTRVMFIVPLMVAVVVKPLWVKRRCLDPVFKTSLEKLDAVSQFLSVTVKVVIPVVRVI